MKGVGVKPAPFSFYAPVGWSRAVRVRCRMSHFDRPRCGGDVHIASKRVGLVNCDAPLDGIVVPF